MPTAPGRQPEHGGGRVGHVAALAGGRRRAADDLGHLPGQHPHAGRARASPARRPARRSGPRGSTRPAAASCPTSGRRPAGRCGRPAPPGRGRRCPGAASGSRSPSAGRRPPRPRPPARPPAGRRRAASRRRTAARRATRASSRSPCANGGTQSQTASRPPREQSVQVGDRRGADSAARAAAAPASPGRRRRRARRRRNRTGCGRAGRRRPGPTSPARTDHEQEPVADAPCHGIVPSADAAVRLRRGRPVARDGPAVPGIHCAPGVRGD